MMCLGRPLTGGQLFDGIRFARHMQVADSAVLWLEEGEVLLSLLNSRSDLAGLTFCAAGDAAGLLEAAQQAGCELIITDLDLLTLYDKMAARLNKHKKWEQKLTAAVVHSADALVEAAAEIAGGMLFVVNVDSARVLYRGGYAKSDDTRICELMDYERLTGTSYEWLNAHMDLETFCCEMEDGGRLYSGLMSGDENLRLLLYTRKELPAEEAWLLLNLTCSGMQTVWAQKGQQSRSQRPFGEVWQDIVHQKLVTEDEISDALAHTDCPPRRFISLILVEVPQKSLLPNRKHALMTHLQELIPQVSVAEQDDGFLFVLSDELRTMQPYPKIDYTAVQKLLEQYDAYMAMGNATSRRDKLRTNYLLVNSTLHLGKALRNDCKQRVFFYEDFAEYVSIDLCINSFSAIMGHDDIVYLTNPDCIKLYRHDQIYQNNLLDVLYQYCLNSANISVAAKACYMHRNTFSAKMEQVMKMIKADLSNGDVRQRMIFSYKVLRYYDKYARINLVQKFSVSPPV